MTQELAASMMIALAVVLVGLAWWGWRNRRVRFRHLEELLLTTLPSSDAVLGCSGLYVATTIADKPMDRVVVGPLGFRAKANFSVHPEGLVLHPQGENPVLLSAPGGVQAGRATWTIDRVVEPEGLVLLRWMLGDTAVDSYLRVVETDQQLLIDAVNGARGGAE